MISLFWVKFKPMQAQEKHLKRLQISNLGNIERDVCVLYDCYFLLSAPPKVTVTTS